jgi:hypothetical protein
MFSWTNIQYQSPTKILGHTPKKIHQHKHKDRTEHVEQTHDDQSIQKKFVHINSQNSRLDVQKNPKTVKTS